MMKNRLYKAAGAARQVWVFVFLLQFFAIFCTRASQPVSFAWDSSTDTNVAGYAIYYGTDSGVYSVRFDVGTNLMATFASLTMGTTYYFTVVSYDGQAMESLPSDELTFTVPTNMSPALNPILNQTIGVHDMLVITNSATVTSDASTNLTYSLVSAPAGMNINPLTGVLTWMPSPSQAGTVTLVTVLVSDDSTPPQTSWQTFTVTVGDMLQVTLNSAVVGAGQSGAVNLSVSSSSPVTNLSFTLDAPAGWIGDLSVQSLFPQNVTVTQNPPGAIHSLITLQTTDGSALPTDQPLVQVDFDAMTNQSSGTAMFQVSGVTAWLMDGQSPMVPSISSSVAVVGQASFLQLQVTNGQPSLTLYGPSGDYQIQSTSNPATGNWINETIVTLTNLSQTLPVTPANDGSMKFFRCSHL